MEQRQSFVYVDVARGFKAGKGAEVTSQRRIRTFGELVASCSAFHFVIQKHIKARFGEEMHKSAFNSKKPKLLVMGIFFHIEAKSDAIPNRCPSDDNAGDRFKHVYKDIFVKGEDRTMEMPSSLLLPKILKKPFSYYPFDF